MSKVAETDEQQHYGRRLLPVLIDDIAVTDPERPFVELVRSTNVGDGCCKVSMGEFANAINRATWWMEKHLGCSNCFKAIAYTGPQDLRYFLLVFAAVKTGHKLFLPSIRNSTPVHLSLLEAYSCDTFLLPSGPVFRNAMRETFLSRPMTVVEIPELDFFLESERVPVYKWNETFEEARLKPLVAVQSSGSTGMPKPINLNHGFLTAIDALLRLSAIECTPCTAYHWKGKRMYLSFPFFHGGGLGALLMCIFYQITVVLPPPSPVTAQLVHDIIDRFHTNIAIIPPAIMVEMAGNSAQLEIFSKLDYACFGGGPLPTDIGNQMASRTHLVNLFASSEAGWMPLELLPSKDWQYIKFHAVTGAQMRPHTDSLYELVIVRDPTLEDFQAAFVTFPDAQEFQTRDLFSKHPTSKGLWLSQGRADDLVVYSTGEKLHPVAFEDVINGHPAVRSALVCGQGRFQSALLVEPMEYPRDNSAVNDVIADIWPTVQRANKDCLAHGRVVKEMILVTKPEKPLPRASKGTVQRRAAVELYLPELDALYNEMEASTLSNGTYSTAQDGSETVNVTQELLRIIGETPGFEDVDQTTNLFDRGMDSLGVLTLRRKIQLMSPKYHFKRNLTDRDIYEARTISTIASCLTGSVATPKQFSADMQSVYEKMVTDLPIVARVPVKTDRKRQVVLLTGSTGSLGSYLLDSLLSSENVEEVICLSRTPDARERQQKSMMAKGLEMNFSKKSVSFLATDFSRPYLGLESKAYRALLGKVTHIVHNAWQVDFNISLEQLASTHIHGVRQLVDFSARSTHGAFIFFISSVSTVFRWSPSVTDDDRVPEDIFEDWSVPELVGYAQSKFVSERILATAAAEAGIPCAICRVGQIAGPTTEKGAWPKHEWLPSLIFSSTYLGYLPSSLGHMELVDWIPVDTLGCIIVELLDHVNTEEPTNALVYHCVNPQKTRWTDVLPFMKDRLALPDLSFNEWVEMLQRSAQSDQDDLERNPALKLLDFFTASARNNKAGVLRYQLDTAKAADASPSLKSMRGVSSEWMDTWMRQWSLI